MTSPHDPHDSRDGAELGDDALGAALGRGVRHRVDAVPTITPAFDGVERRARQITTRRRALAGAAIGVFLLLGGIGLTAVLGDDDEAGINTAVDGGDVDDESPADDDAADDDAVDDDAVDGDAVDGDAVDGDPGIDGPTGDDTQITDANLGVYGIVDGRQLVRLRDDGTPGEEPEIVHYEVGAGETLTDAVVLADGSFLVEVQGDPATGAGQVFHITASDEIEINGFGDLAGATHLDGVAYAFVGDVPDFRAGPQPEDLATGDLHLIRLDDYSSEVFEPDAYGIEWSVEHVDVRGGIALVASNSEGGPWWAQRGLHGTTIDAPDPDLREFGPGSSWVTQPRHRAEGGFWWLQNDGPGEWTLRGGQVNAPEVIVPFDLPDEDFPGSLELELGHGRIAVNVIAWEDGYIETIWVDLAGEPITTRVVEQGPVRFAQSPQTTAPVAPPTSTPSDGSWPGDLVTLIDGDVHLVDWDGSTVPIADNSEPITAVDLVGGIDGGDGSMVIVQGGQGRWGEVIHLDGEATVLSADGYLAGTAMIDGRPQAFVADRVGDDQEPTPLVTIDLSTGERSTFAAAVNGHEWSINRVDATDHVVLVAVDGLQPEWELRHLRRIFDLASPTDGRFGPEWGDATFPDLEAVPCCPRLSDDGNRLYWLESPTEGFQHSTLTPVTIQGIDIFTGDLLDPIEVALPGSENPVTFDLDVAGGQALISVSGMFAPIPVPPVAGLLVDLTTGESRQLDLPGGPWAFVD